MNNGDRLTGTIESWGQGVFKFKTEYAGIIEIEWKEVKSLTTEKDVVVLTTDEELISGKLVAAPGKTVMVETSDGESIDVEEKNIAFINPEDWRIGKATRHSGHVNAALEFDGGKTDTNKMDFDIDHTARRKNDRTHFYGIIGYDTSKGEKTRDKWSAFSKYDLFVTKRKFYSLSGMVEHDWGKGLDLRYHVGPSIGYQVWESDEKNLSTEWGVYWTSTDLSGQETRTGPGTGWRIIYDQYLYKRFLQAYHRQSMLFSNKENMNFKSLTGLRMPLASGLLASAELEANWDAETADDGGDAEFITRFKLGYGW